jgi:hypothetical protein
MLAALLHTIHFTENDVSHTSLSMCCVQAQGKHWSAHNYSSSTTCPRISRQYKIEQCAAYWHFTECVTVASWFCTNNIKAQEIST